MNLHGISTRDVEKRLRKEGWRKVHTPDKTNGYYEHAQYRNVITLPMHTLSKAEKHRLFETLGWADWLDGYTMARERAASAIDELTETRRKLDASQAENAELRTALQEILDLVDRMEKPAICACGVKLIRAGGRCVDCVRQWRVRLHTV